jgi:hypothetical protein
VVTLLENTGNFIDFGSTIGILRGVGRTDQGGRDRRAKLLALSTLL